MQDVFMRRLHYSNGTVLVSDLTCKALLRYARALADANKSDIVTIPVISDVGSQGSAHFLIGPSSQIFSTPVEHSQNEPVDRGAIAHLERETKRLQPARPTWASEMQDIPTLDEYGLEEVDFR